MTAAYRDRHDYLVAELNAIDGLRVPAGRRNVLRLSTSRLASRRDSDCRQMTALVEHLLNEARHRQRAGLGVSAAPGYVRLSFASSSMAQLRGGPGVA